MHISAAGVSGPDRGLLGIGLNRQPVMLLNPQILDGMSGLPEGTQQLWLPKLFLPLFQPYQQGLPPLRMAGSHGQDPTFQR